MTEKANDTEKKNTKHLRGVVVSDKQDKTVTVLVKRFVKDKKYGKFVARKKKFKAHDETNAKKEGDEVTIKECRPLSKDKHFVVVEE